VILPRTTEGGPYSSAETICALDDHQLAWHMDGLDLASQLNLQKLYLTNQFV
jgi:hypothetical protein